MYHWLISSLSLSGVCFNCVQNGKVTWYYAGPTLHQLILEEGKRRVCFDKSKIRMIANAAGEETVHACMKCDGWAGGWAGRAGGWAGSEAAQQRIYAQWPPDLAHTTNQPTRTIPFFTHCALICSHWHTQVVYCRRWRRICPIPSNAPFCR